VHRVAAVAASASPPHAEAALGLQDDLAASARDQVGSEIVFQGNGRVSPLTRAHEMFSGSA
jgi:hypothetical protein